MSLAQRIKDARLAAKLTQVELAALVGIKQQSLQKLESGRSKSTVYLLELSKALHVEPSWLQFGTGIPPFGLAAPAAHIIAGKVPIIGWDELDKWMTYIDTSVPPNHWEWVTTPDPSNRYIFVLRIKGDAMMGKNKTFNPGSLIFVTSKILIPEHDSYVIALEEGATEAVFRKFIIEGGKQYLKPLNAEYPAEQIVENNYRIVGQVIKHEESL